MDVPRVYRVSKGECFLPALTDGVSTHPNDETLKNTPVNGCSICGQPERSHGMSYKEGHGLHTWQEPSDTVRETRLTGTPGNHNDETLSTYDAKIAEYVAGTPKEVSEDLKTWIQASLDELPQDAAIFELGSGFGRDADYMETLGYVVQRTDASAGFVGLLHNQGKSARMFNALTDDYPQGQDLVFADAVLLHFTRTETANVLKNVHSSLKDGGRFAFSLKKGDGEGWSSEKLDSPRFFTYWDENEAKRAATEAGFTRVESVGHDSPLWMHLIAYK